MHQEQIWNLIAKKLSGESNPSELQELERLLRENPELHYSMQTIIDLWRIEQNTNIEASYETFNKHLMRMQDHGVEFPASEADRGSEAHPFPAKTSKRKYFWAALAVPVIALVFLFAHQFTGVANPPEWNNHRPGSKEISEVFTKNGSKTNLILPDGTKVWLNAGSTLTYDSSYGKKIREISLTGEGFFDVVKNKEKPFIIHTSKINIKVLGTEFNVKSYPTDKTTEASLIRGSIEVTFKDKPNKKVILKPNEKIVVENAGRIRSNIIRPAAQDKDIIHDIADDVAVKNLTYEHKTGAIIETSWVENKLIFQDESFEDIALQLERWYGVNIRFENQQLKENHLTGSFKNETIRQALDALKFTASFNYTIDGNNNITIY